MLDRLLGRLLEGMFLEVVMTRGDAEFRKGYRNHVIAVIHRSCLRIRYATRVHMNMFYTCCTDYEQSVI